jgi:hypothetical protein
MTRRFQFSLKTIFASVSFAAIACALFRLSVSTIGRSNLQTVGGLAVLCGLAFIGASIGALWRNALRGAIAMLALVMLADLVYAIFCVISSWFR